MPLPVCLCFCLSLTILPDSFQCQNLPNGRIQRKKVFGILDHRCSSCSKRSWLAWLHWWMYVCLSLTNVALAQDNNNLYKLCVGHFSVKADTYRWVLSKVPLYCKRNFLLKCHAWIQKRLSGEQAIIGPTAVSPLKWRFAGRPMWPNIECWLRSFASFSWLRTSIAKDPYSIVISHGSAPLSLWKRAWMYRNPENFTLIDDIPSMWHSSTNKSHVSNIYGSRGGEWGSGHPTYTDKHTHARARVLADPRDVGLLRNTGIDPLSPPPHNSKSCPTSILPSASETPGPLPLKQQSGSAYAIILTLQFVNWCSLFLK